MSAYTGEAHWYATRVVLERIMHRLIRAKRSEELEALAGLSEAELEIMAVREMDDRRTR